MNIVLLFILRLKQIGHVSVEQASCHGINSLYFF